MTDTPTARKAFRIGAWTVDPSSGEIQRGETRHELQPRVMDVLEFLALNAQRVVGKEEILSAVWGDRFLTDGVLWRCVSRLRTVFEEDPSAPQVIQTLRGRGYRLVAEVEFEPCEPVGTKRRLPARWLIAAVLAVLVALAGWYLAAGADTDGPVDSASREAQAVAAYRRALALDPAYVPAVQDLGAFFNSSGALDSALYWNLRALELPDVAGLRWSQRLELSATWILLHELSEAHREVRAARQLAPDQPLPGARLSEIELRLGRVVEARRVAARALNEHPRFVPLLGIAASVEQVAGNLDSAMSLVERATSDPASRGNYDAWLRRASVARGLGQRKNSDAILASLDPAADKMIEMGLDGTSNRVRQAAIHAIRGETDRALARLSEAVSDGYLDGRWLELDPIFAGLRDEREFQLLIQEIEARVHELRRKATEAGLLPLSAPNLPPDTLTEASPGAPDSAG